ncbi:unnamed protein product [Rhodiola kirilowii]
MFAASVREMTANFGKLEKFEGVNFRRWQKKMHFLLTSLKVVHVLSTPIPAADDNGPIDAIRKRSKWENDDYILDTFSMVCLITCLMFIRMLNPQRSCGMHLRQSTCERMLLARSFS